MQFSVIFIFICMIQKKHYTLFEIFIWHNCHFPILHLILLTTTLVGALLGAEGSGM